MVSELAGEGAMPLPKPASHAELQVGLRRQIRSSLRRGVDSRFNLSAVLSFQSRVSRSRFVKILSKVLIIPMFAVFNRSSRSKSVRSSAELVIPLFVVFLRSRSTEILSAELVAVVSSPQRRTRNKNQLLTQIRDFASEKSQGKRRISNLKNRIAVFNRSRVLVNAVFAVFDRDFGSRSSPQRRTREIIAVLVHPSSIAIPGADPMNALDMYSKTCIRELANKAMASKEVLLKVLLVVTLKPVLAWHMNCKSQSDSVELNDSENQFSITEKATQDACNLSSMLDASKANPIMEGWEISKVTVLLLDSKKENCFLRFGSVNNGETTPSNSHPQISGAGNDFLVVHNGVIINYGALKETPIQLDFTFESETDTEVILKLAKFVFDKAKEGEVMAKSQKAEKDNTPKK
nr:uncharacterized protein LOC109161584 isoform X3 [Ipomoea trifida]